MRKERREGKSKSKRWNKHKKKSGGLRDREKEDESRLLLKTEDIFTSLGLNECE